MKVANEHNEEYFDHLKDIMLDIQIVHPTLPVIMLGDFNIVLEDRDSINRNANMNEVKNYPNSHHSQGGLEIGHTNFTST